MNEGIKNAPAATLHEAKHEYKLFSEKKYTDQYKETVESCQTHDPYFSAEKIKQSLEGLKPADKLRALPPELHKYVLEGMRSLQESDPAEGTTEPQRRFKLMREDQLERKKADWLIHGFIERDSLGLMFGDSGSGKSFIAIDWGLSVATGREWIGRKVTQGGVVYICGEGQRGVPKRIDAWKAYHGMTEPVPFYPSTVPAQMIDADSLNHVSQALREDLPEPPQLIIIDTLSRNMGGDENSSTDMPAFIAACDRLRHETGAAVLIVHHTGHSSKERGRGHSSMPAAIDHSFRTDIDAQKVTRLECTKQKDAQFTEPQAFKQMIVELEIEGTTETSLVLVPTEYQDKATDNTQQIKGKNQQKAVELLASIFNKRRYKLEQSGRDPETARVTRTEWESAIRLEIPAKSSRSGLTDKLINKGIVIERQGFVYLYGSGFGSGGLIEPPEPNEPTENPIRTERTQSEPFSNPVRTPAVDPYTIGEEPPEPPGEPEPEPERDALEPEQHIEDDPGQELTDELEMDEVTLDFVCTDVLPMYRKYGYFEFPKDGNLSPTASAWLEKNGYTAPGQETDDMLAIALSQVVPHQEPYSETLRKAAQEAMRYEQGEADTQQVDARELHRMLAVETDFSKWITDRVQDYGFREGEDFTCDFLSCDSETTQAVYTLSDDMAKQLTMIESAGRGKQARHYFTEVEKRYRASAPVVESAQVTTHDKEDEEGYIDGCPIF